jgi:glycosyltransferase involved in cell wall biosynthesis
MNGETINPSILVLMAALNEEEGIGPTIGDLKSSLGDVHVLVVDGFSQDKTAEIARAMGAEVVLREGKGKGDAIGYGLSQVNKDYDYIVLIDADYTYPARFVREMIELINESPHLGMICGNRFNAHFHTERMNDLFYLGNRVLAFTHNLLNGVTMRDPLSGLRVVRWNILKSWKPKAKGFDVEVEMNHEVERQGYGISEVDIEYRKRLGEKKLKAHDGIEIFKRMIAEIQF